MQKLSKRIILFSKIYLTINNFSKKSITNQRELTLEFDFLDLPFRVKTSEFLAKNYIVKQKLGTVKKTLEAKGGRGFPPT